MSGGQGGLCNRARGDEYWNQALTRYRRTEAALAAAARTKDESLYDHLGVRNDAALDRLLRLRAPDAAALALKLDLLIAHQAWELSFAEPALAAIQQDAHRLAASAAV